MLLGFLALYCAIVYLAPGSAVDRSDEGVYLGYAHRLIHGHYATTAGGDFNYLWFGPGLPGLLAPFVAIGLPVELIRLLGPLLLALAVYLLYRVLDLYVDRRTALIGGGALALYYPTYRLLPRLFSEPLAIVLLLTAMYCGTRYMREGRRWMLVASGAALAGVVMTRVEYGWVIVGSLALSALWWALARHPMARRSVAMFAVAGILCLPWLGYTYHLTHKALYWGNSGGLSLYWMASPYSRDLGEPHTVSEVFTDPNLAEHRPYFRSIAQLGPVAHDAALRHTATKEIKRHPGEYAKRLVYNFSRLWFRTPFSFQGFGLKALFYLIPGALLLASLVLAAARMVRRRATLPAEALPFILVAVLAFCVHLAAAGYPRSIEPLLPVFILFVAIGLTARSASAVEGDPVGRRSRRPIAPSLQRTREQPGALAEQRPERPA